MELIEILWTVTKAFMKILSGKLPNQLILQVFS